MVATVQIVEANGTAETLTQKDGSTLRFKNADNATVDALNPMVIPATGQDWSFQKWTQLNVTVAPATNLTNLKFYTDGTGWSAADAFVKGWAAAETTYATPIAASGSSQFTADMFSYTSGAALDLGTAAVTGTGLKGDHAHLALEVEAGATQGTLTAETLTYSYDEL
jgi:hypothetical protein